MRRKCHRTSPQSRNTALRHFVFWFLKSWSRPTKWVSESQTRWESGPQTIPGVTLHLLPMLDAPHTQGTGCPFPDHPPHRAPPSGCSPEVPDPITLTPSETFHHPLSPLRPSITPSEIPLNTLTPSELPGSRARTDGNQPQFPQLSCLPCTPVQVSEGNVGLACPSTPRSRQAGKRAGGQRRVGVLGSAPCVSSGLPGPVSGRGSGSQHRLPRQRTSMFGERERPRNSPREQDHTTLPHLPAPESEGTARLGPQWLRGGVPCSRASILAGRPRAQAPPTTGHPPTCGDFPRQVTSCHSAPPSSPPSWASSGPPP